MSQADADLVTETAAVCRRFLIRHVDADWTTTIPGMEMTVARVVAHASEACLWYSIDLVAAGQDLLTVEHRVKTDQPASMIVDTLTTYAEVLARVLRAADAGDRGFHPWGTADPSGFAAIACDELLIHTDDAARGLGADFAPPEEIAATVRERLFPWGAPDGSAWDRLRWCNGRIALGDQPQRERWRWHCAPLDEWDGTDPTD
ncbi:MAG: hypothetical protein AAF567_03830 [Actinomycetota bacterium]